MKYTATLNGKQYEVELERIDAYEPMPRYGEAPAVAPAPVAAPAAPAPAPAPAAPAPAPAAAPGTGGSTGSRRNYRRGSDAR